MLNMLFAKISVFHWCLMVVLECQTLFRFLSNFFFYLFIYFFCLVLNTINYFSFPFSNIIIYFFSRTIWLKQNVFLLKKHHDLWVSFLSFRSCRFRSGIHGHYLFSKKGFSFGLCFLKKVNWNNDIKKWH